MRKTLLTLVAGALLLPAASASAAVIRGTPGDDSLTDPDRHHFNIQFMGTVETSDGFAGRLTGPDIDNGSGLFGAEEGRGVFTSILSAGLANAEGQRFHVHFNLHVTFVDGVGGLRRELQLEVCR